MQGVVYALLAAKAHTKIESRSEGNNDHFLHFFLFFIASYRIRVPGMFNFVYSFS